MERNVSPTSTQYFRLGRYNLCREKSDWNNEKLRFNLVERLLNQFIQRIIQIQMIVDFIVQNMHLHCKNNIFIIIARSRIESRIEEISLHILAL